MSRSNACPALSLVVCTLDESESVGPVLREAAEALSGVDYEILVVDDSTDDRTAAVVRAHALANPAVRLVRREGERGLASAAIAGWDAARGDTLAIMDGDGQHDPNMLPKLLARVRAFEADLAVASRYVEERPSGLNRVRHLMSRLATRATCFALRAKASDPMSGFFVMSRSWYEAARPRLSGLGFKILADLLVSGPRRPRVIELPASLRERHGGASKLDARVIAELFALLIEKRSRGLIPSRFTLFACVGATGVAVHLAVLALLGGPLGAPFWMAQAAAILTAMTTNFFLNNVLTFRDLRLRGAAMRRGLLAFYVSCAGGALLSEAVGASLHQAGAHALLAGVAGAGLASIWNYWSSARAAWRTPPAAQPAPAEPAQPSLAA